MFDRIITRAKKVFGVQPKVAITTKPLEVSPRPELSNGDYLRFLVPDMDSVTLSSFLKLPKQIQGAILQDLRHKKDTEHLLPQALYSRAGELILNSHIMENIPSSKGRDRGFEKISKDEEDFEAFMVQAEDDADKAEALAENIKSLLDKKDETRH